MPTERSPLDERLVESVAERRIREAMERGEFDDLPGAGEPLADLDREYDPDWWAKRWVRRERLADAMRELRERRHRERVRAETGLAGAADRLAEIDARLALLGDEAAGRGEPTGR